MNAPDTDKFIAGIEDADFYIVYLDDRKIGCRCVRSKKALKKELLAHDDTGEKVDVMPCYWDDKRS